MTLRELGDGSSQTQLVEALGIMMPSLTRTLGQLEAQGLIRRRPSKADRRTKLIYFTAEGLHVLSQLEQKASVARSALLQSLAQDDLVRLDHILDEVERSAIRLLEKGGM